MGGSTGTVSRVIAPTNVINEDQHRLERAQLAFPGLLDGAKRTTGIIKEINSESPRLVRAYDEEDGTVLCDGKWIELNHSAQEIAEKWGKVQVGFKVRVTYYGPSGSGADATIIAKQNDDIQEPGIENDVARGLYAVFAPGIGIG